jgi:hypothetical protein
MAASRRLASCSACLSGPLCSVVGEKTTIKLATFCRHPSKYTKIPSVGVELLGTDGRIQRAPELRFVSECRGLRVSVRRGN